MIIEENPYPIILHVYKYVGQTSQRMIDKQ